MSKGNAIFLIVFLVLVAAAFAFLPGHLDVGYLGAFFALALILGVCSVLYFTISSPDHHD